MSTPELSFATPAELIAALPHLLGFIPTNDIVALMLGPAHRQAEVPLRAAIRCPASIDPEQAQRFPSTLPPHCNAVPQRTLDRRLRPSRRKPCAAHSAHHSHRLAPHRHHRAPGAHHPQRHRARPLDRPRHRLLRTHDALHRLTGHRARRRRRPPDRAVPRRDATRVRHHRSRPATRPRSSGHHRTHRRHSRRPAPRNHRKQPSDNGPGRARRNRGDRAQRTARRVPAPRRRP